MSSQSHAPAAVLHTDWSKRHYGAGALAGLVAGIAMAMVGMAVAGAMGLGMLMPVKSMAAALFGVDALVGGMPVVMAGMMMHMMISAVLGLIFAAIIGSAGPRKAMAAGIVYGIVIWAVMTFIGLPLVDPVMQARVAMMPGWWFVFHLIYGGMLFLTPVFWRR